ncbi:hypothetical protein U3A55_08305 [Salarchaeum sp. III]|uniref:hypothetical protein n=1 Tax=Salarchaeum sp. III TaxID=3107927 RepID=UPI002ED7F560
MNLQGWVTETFGGSGATILDESVYGDDELRKDVIKLEHRLEKLEGEMDDHATTYRTLLEQGADASDLRRTKYAQKAKFEKKKYAIKKKQYRAKSVKLGTLLSVQGMREITSSRDEEALAVDDALEDADAAEIQSEILDRMAEFGVEVEDLQEIQSALDVPIMDAEIAMDTDEEETRMEQLAAADVSSEQIDIEDDMDVDAESIDLDSNDALDDL